MAKIHQQGELQPHFLLKDLMCFVLPHSDSSLEEDVGNTVLFPDPAADTLVSRIQAAGLRHEAIRTAD